MGEEGWARRVFTRRGWMRKSRRGGWARGVDEGRCSFPVVAIPALISRGCGPNGTGGFRGTGGGYGGTDA